jgi:hypothetical protein
VSALGLKKRLAIDWRRRRRGGSLSLRNGERPREVGGVALFMERRVLSLPDSGVGFDTRFLILFVSFFICSFPPVPPNTESVSFCLSFIPRLYIS